MTNLTNEGKIDNDAIEKLKGLIESIEKYEDDKIRINESIKEIFDEAKSFGFDIKTIRKILKLKKLDKERLEEEEFLLETYKNALGLN